MQSIRTAARDLTRARALSDDGFPPLPSSDSVRDPMEHFEVHPKSLKHLLSNIHERELALPDFQRDFVWQPRETELLIESIAQNFPAGSLLFMAYRDDTFAPRAIENAPPLAAAPLELILDGQQRLTSLYQAFYGQGDYRYFVDFGVLIGPDPDVEEAIFRTHKNRTKGLLTLPEQARRLIWPLGELFNGQDFNEWLDKIPAHRDDLDAELKSTLRDAYRRFLGPIVEYQFPVVSLKQSTSLEAVCSIFETLNKSGVRLSVFELLAARYWAKGVDLRRRWAEARERHELLTAYDIDEYYVLQAIALRVKRSTQRGAVLALTVDEVNAHWDAVTGGFQDALTLLRDDCGVLTARWLPYAYMLVPLAALWDEHIAIHGPRAGANRDKVQQWFWRAALNARYDRAANSQASRDFIELDRWCRGGAEPESVTSFGFDVSRLSAITPRQQSVYKALMAMVLRRRPADFHQGKTLTSASFAGQDAVDDHHVFPRAYLASIAGGQWPTETVDSILNRTLIDRITNIRIGKRAPSDYLTEIADELTEQGVRLSLDTILEAHGLPTGDDSPLRADDFAGFLEARRRFFAVEIERVTGAAIGGEGEPVPETLDAVA
jgi:hypothetical protein